MVSVNQQYIDYLRRQKLGWNIISEAGASFTVGLSEVEAYNQLNEIMTKHGIANFWHPTCIKFDDSTLQPGVRHRPQSDVFLNKIAIIDIGIIIDGFEVGCGKSFGFSDSGRKLAQSAKDIFLDTATFLKTNPATPPAQIYAWMSSRAKHYGYEQIAPTAGHALGAYPTPKKDPKISPKDTNKNLSKGGWMIEVHISDGTHGAFYEDLIWI